MNFTSTFGNHEEIKKLAVFSRCWAPVLLILLSILVIPQISSANTIYVTSLEDKISSTGGCSLKEAIYASNLQESSAVTGYASDGTPQTITTQCVAGSGNDTIVLPTLGLLQFSLITNDAGNFAGPTATPVVTAANVVIEANGATLQRIGSVNMRLFAVAAGTHLTINNAHIKDFIAQGGSGTDGGGGGLGAGGAIFVGVGTSPGALIVENSTFEANFAIGGNGSTCPPPNPLSNCLNGGGGGGMGGNGGNGSVDLNSGGGGGGGARGNGGSGAGSPSGGGGGGTLTSGTASVNSGGAAGLFCGGRGGDASDEGNDGSSAPCAGGGGGGGGQAVNSLNPFGTTVGGNGNAGGGGGGGPDQGGNGGWGGGGGSSSETNGAGGNGGFGGGGGAGHDEYSLGSPGSPGTFGGSADDVVGGGGAGLGGAIFNNNSSVVIQNSTFTANDAVGGRKDTLDSSAGTGEGHGGAIFAVNGSTRMLNDTIDGNLSSGVGGGIYIWQDPSPFAFLLGTNTTTFILRNSIVADSAGSEDAANNQCTMNAEVITGGDWRGNLIQNDDASFPCDYALPQPSGIVSTADPLLGPLQNNQGFTPTMAITERSPAWNAADPTTSATIDQRGEGRPSNGGFDIGAFELCLTGLAPVQRPCIISGGLEGGEGESFEDLTIQVSSAAAGTTIPAPGTYGPQIDTVSVVSATANPGYIFLNWTGNVADPTNPTTAVIMDRPQTITANFSPCACAGDVSATISVTRGPFSFNLATGRFYQSVTLANNSANTITGPISVVLDSLSANATLFNATSTTDSLEPPGGSSYINATAASLAPGQATSIQLQFTDPTKTAITYNTRVLAGPGSR